MADNQELGKTEELIAAEAELLRRENAKNRIVHTEGNVIHVAFRDAQMSDAALIMELFGPEAFEHLNLEPPPGWNGKEFR